MTTQDALWAGAAAALVLTVAAGFAEWRRARRAELDNAGWVPWRGVQVASLFAVAALVVLAMRA